MSSLVKAAWRYRGFITSSVANEFKSRLGRSRFGTAWIVLQPLAQVLIFATILSNVLAARLAGIDSKYAYAIYLIAGTLCWSLFSEIIMRCTTVFIDNGSLLKKVHFPRIALPAIAIGSASVNNVALLAVSLVILPVLGILPDWHFLWLPLLMGLTVALAAGIGLLLGTLNVFARDVGQVVAVALQFWFWVTPIVYPMSIVPEGFRATLNFNPAVPLVVSYQNILLYGQPPSPQIAWVAVLAVVLLTAGLFLFRRASSEMVDVL
ncbi:ABC transporter permease [Luteimonas gilva]|uniref:Transport permease protein n=1 Tax=Luteimonas gilva TaxID=2572684 RepID=A0A4U5JJI0_9GAMM|nr:ABC transporter permease [Luteimonas gilva]TKR29712.1 ABC transporter permease [Luteimonas gilva]